MNGSSQNARPHLSVNRKFHSNCINNYILFILSLIFLFITVLP
ncbi:hypothetical protein FTUN_7603 [Frigoriglobus tundricola]|uniref:Uncharacterized protein n=1 Tax=Frigoriglobus tundricola TaxID=2774151 RepID=A0A6M5Z360_9BACT|nr:hypothetical protein FTUN_7603 [Frigoriglobus tundricola]